MEIHFRLQQILRVASVHIAQILRQNLIEEESTKRGLHIAGHLFPVCVRLFHPDGNSGMKGTCLILVGENRLVYILKELALSKGAGSLLRQIIDAEHHILRRHRHRAAIRRFQQVVRGEQKESALCLRLHGQGKMDCHLVAVEVSVECGTYERMEFDRLTFHKNRLKRLDTQSVQGRRTV